MTLTLARMPVKPELANCRLDLYGIVPDRLLGLDLQSIGEQVLQFDGRDALLREHFDIVDGPRDGLLLTGDLSCADRVGGGMQLGTMKVESDVGRGLAANMRQGNLFVAGSAGDYACSQLRGGRVRIAANVGDYCGAAGPGLRRGMRGGTCVIGGNAGRFLGYRMRRGMMVVAGNVAEGCASSMIAGSIVIVGAAMAPLGVGMRRGSVIVLSGVPTSLPVGFTPFEPIRLSYLPLLLGETEPDLPANCRIAIQKGRWLRSLGDRASQGLGEVLCLGTDEEELLQ